MGNSGSRSSALCRPARHAHSSATVSAPSSSRRSSSVAVESGPAIGNEPGRPGVQHHVHPSCSCCRHGRRSLSQVFAHRHGRRTARESVLRHRPRRDQRRRPGIGTPARRHRAMRPSPASARYSSQPRRLPRANRSNSAKAPAASPDSCRTDINWRKASSCQGSDANGRCAYSAASSAGFSEINVQDRQISGAVAPAIRGDRSW